MLKALGLKLFPPPCEMTGANFFFFLFLFPFFIFNKCYQFSKMNALSVAD